MSAASLVLGDDFSAVAADGWQGLLGERGLGDTNFASLSKNILPGISVKFLVALNSREAAAVLF